jgi:hypothetical protein
MIKNVGVICCPLRKGMGFFVAGRVLFPTWHCILTVLTDDVPNDS